MNKYFDLFAAALLVAAVGLGCGYLGDSGSPQTQNSNARAGNTVAGNTNIQANAGVPECDRVLADIEAELNNPDDSFVVKAAKGAVLERIKDSIRQEIEQNANRAELVKACGEFKKQFDNYKSGQQPSSNAEQQN